MCTKLRHSFIEHDFQNETVILVVLKMTIFLALIFIIKTFVTFMFIIHILYDQAFLPVDILHGLWNPEAQCRIQKGSPVIPIPSKIKQIRSIKTYFFKIHSNIAPPTYA